MATPFKMKNSALYKSAKHGSPMQGNFTSKVKKAAKEIYEKTMPKVLQDANKKIYDKVTGKKSKAKSETSITPTKEPTKEPTKNSSPKGEYTTKENPVSRPDNKYEREGDKYFGKQKK